MTYFTLALGFLMFTHFGCAVLKHDSSKSDFILKFSLIAKLILSVLIIRASINENFDDLLMALIGNTTINMVLSLYIWVHGITFLDIGKHMHKIKLRDLPNIIKNTF